MATPRARIGFQNKPQHLQRNQPISSEEYKHGQKAAARAMKLIALLSRHASMSGYQSVCLTAFESVAEL